MDTGGACSTGKTQWFEKKGRKKGEPYARLSRADTIKTTLICAAQSASFYLFDAFSRVVGRWWTCGLGGGGEEMREN